MAEWGSAWPAYVSVAERRLKAEKASAKMKKAGQVLAPITAFRGGLAKTFWGKAWSANLEQYGDYANRLPRGRSYVRNGSVIDLNIRAGEVEAKVMGSSLYLVSIAVAPVHASRWKALCQDCSGSIDSLVSLLQGKLSETVMRRICDPKLGLFPSPQDIRFGCSCPDGAYLCKHVAAALYGIAVRFDAHPEMLFSLRGVNSQDLILKAKPLNADAMGDTAGANPSRSRKLLDTGSLDDVFGIEIAPSVAPDAALIAKRNGPKPAGRKLAKKASNRVTKKVPHWP